MSGWTNSHPAITAYVELRALADAEGDRLFQEYGGAAVGRMEHDKESDLHYVPVVGLIGDIEIAKTHVWEDGRVEVVFGA